MAATSLARYPVVNGVIEGYMEAEIPQSFALLNSGVLVNDGRGESVLTTIGGHLIQSRGYNRDQTTWQTPAANTDLTINNLDTYKDVYPLLSRAQNYGIEDLAAIVAGDTGMRMNIGAQLAYNYRWNLETLLFNQLLPALFTDADAILADSHLVNHSDEAFAYDFVEEAMIFLGDLPEPAMSLFVHPVVYRRANMRAIVDTSLAATTTTEFNATGAVFMGRIGGMNVFMDSLIPQNADQTYNTYILGLGSINWIWQKQQTVEMDRNILKAGGTDFAQWTFRAALGVKGTTWAGATPTLIGGTTDALIGTAASWTKRTTEGDSTVIDDELIKVACIKSLATAGV